MPHDPTPPAFTSDTTINAVLELIPGAPAVLTAFDLDTCCGGGLTLAEACADANVRVDRVLDALHEGVVRP